METATIQELAYTLESDKSFDEVADNLERIAPENQFRVLATHDVQETLREKGFERGPLKIIEICNAGFADQALKKDVNVAMFMPCRYVVHTEGGKTTVTLARPSVIGAMLPEADVDEIAKEVEEILKKIMHDAV